MNSWSPKHHFGHRVRKRRATTVPDELVAEFRQFLESVRREDFDVLMQAGRRRALGGDHGVRPVCDRRRLLEQQPGQIDHDHRPSNDHDNCHRAPLTSTTTTTTTGIAAAHR